MLFRFTSEQNTILNSFYHSGMHGSGSDCQQLLEAACHESGLGKEQVVVSINNMSNTPLSLSLALLALIFAIIIMMLSYSHLKYLCLFMHDRTGSNVRI